MLSRAYRWFYCLPIWKAFFWVILGACVFLWLREKFRERGFWNWAVGAMLMAWFAVAFCYTLGRRSTGAVEEVRLIPFYSYYLVWLGGNPEMIRSNLMNVMLFWPAGLLGAEVLPGSWKPVWRVLLVFTVGALLGLGIECAQYNWGLGLPEVDDLIHNSLGALLGALAGAVPSAMWSKMNAKMRELWSRFTICF